MRFAGGFRGLSLCCSRKMKRSNLTAVRTPEGVALRHITDSLTAAGEIPHGASVADVGTGGGFPALPLAAARADIRVTAIDSTAKKLAAVERMAKEADISNIVTLSGRAEELSRGGVREAFDVVISRAVAPLPLLCELCLPLCRVGGKFIAMKSASEAAQTDMEAYSRAVKALGGGEVRIVPAPVFPDDGGEILDHLLVIAGKLAPTPEKYPRTWAKMQKNPL